MAKDSVGLPGGRAVLCRGAATQEAYRCRPAAPPLPVWGKWFLKRHCHGRRHSQAARQLDLQSLCDITGARLPLACAASPRQGRCCDFIVVKGLHPKILTNRGVQFKTTFVFVCGINGWITSALTVRSFRIAGCQCDHSVSRRSARGTGAAQPSRGAGSSRGDWRLAFPLAWE